MTPNCHMFIPKERERERDQLIITFERNRTHKVLKTKLNYINYTQEAMRPYTKCYLIDDIDDLSFKYLL